jgi:hypothetical protein
MTKKDYQAIARAIYETCDSGKDNRIIVDLMDKLCLVFKVDNPRFDRSRFKEACLTGTCKGMRKAAK